MGIVSVFRFEMLELGAEEEEESRWVCTLYVA